MVRTIGNGAIVAHILAVAWLPKNAKSALVWVKNNREAECQGHGNGEKSVCCYLISSK
jgi:hypothetical protein